MRSLPASIAVAFIAATSVQATDLPTVKAPLPTVTVLQGGAVSSVDLRTYFEVADIHGQIVQLRTSLGSFNIELLPATAPLSVANFLSYVNGGKYANSFIHRSDQGLGVIQGGGYFINTAVPLDVEPIVKDPPIALEYSLPNVRGTLSMARTSELNSGTSEWFVNAVDNTTTLGQTNGGGYAVFGRVTGTGMTVVDAIHALTAYNAGIPFNQLPLTGYTSGTPIAVANLVVMNAAEAVPVFPATAGQNAVVQFSVANTNTAVVTTTVSASTLNIALVPGAAGIADVTVTATDTNGNAVQNAFRITVTPSPPEIVVEQPAGSDLADGGSRTFSKVTVGSSADLVFTIKNTAAGALNLTGTPKVAVSGADTAMFTVATQPSSPVASLGGSTTFTVRFAPTSAGPKTAALLIENDDGDENPFDISLSGTGNARPTLTLPATPVFAEPTSASGAVVTFSVTANDGEDGPLTPVLSRPSGSTFPIGDTTVNVSATDSDGGQRTGSFTVRVAFLRPSSPTVTIGAQSGEPAPGAGVGALPVGTVLSSFGPPAISDFRKVAARVTMLAGRTPLAGIYVEGAAGTSELLAFQGGTAPGIFAAGATFGRFIDPVISPGGSVAFVATVQGSGVPRTEDFGVWTNAFGSALELVLREGNDVPGLPPGAKLKAVSSLALRDGELLALLTLSASPGIVSPLNDAVLLRVTGAGTATVLLREGQLLAGIPGSRIRTFSVLRPSLTSEGQGRWHADGLALAKVDLYDGRTLLVKIASDGTATPLLANTDSAPQVDPQLRWRSFTLPAMGGNGTGFVVAATLQQRLGVSAENDTALLFSPDGAEWSMFAREGSEAPVSPAGPLFATLLDPVVNDAGEIAFLASLQGPGTTARNRAGIFGGTPDNLGIVARLGEHPPDEAGVATTSMWSSFVTLALPDGPGAGVVFLALTRGGDTTAANSIGIWAADSQGAVRRQLRTGDVLTPGGSPIAGVILLNATLGAYGVARSFNAVGSIAVLATFADGTQALLRLDVP